MPSAETKCVKCRWCDQELRIEHEGPSREFPAGVEFVPPDCCDEPMEEFQPSTPEENER